MARIAIVASARYPIRQPFAGGLEVLTYRLAQALRGRGHRVRLFASQDSDPELGAEPALDESHGMQLSRLSEIDPSMVAPAFLQEHHAYQSLMVRLQRQEIQADVVHNHSLHYLPIAMAPTVPAPVLTTLHTPPTPWLESAMAQVPPGAPHFASVSAANAAAWPDPGRIGWVVPNGVPLEEWTFCASPDSIRAVWAGRIVPEKGPHLAIDAARTAGVELVLAGPVGQQEYYDREIVPRLGSDVRHVGHLDGQDLAGLVRSSSVLVATPCWEEPFGLVVMEALACGTPVAGFARGAVPEVVTEACAVLAPAGDVDGLAEAILAARGLDRRACRQHAEAHGSIDAMVSRYEDVYEELA